MSTVWEWLTRNADWMSAVLGLLSALVLAVPLIAELPKRRRHDVVLKIKRQPPLSPRPASEDDSEELSMLEAEMTSDRMGGYYEAAWTVASGLFLLALSFALALIYALNKS